MYQYRPLLSVSVSSRAPVWGASERNSEVLVVPKVSSRAPVWGASDIVPVTDANGKFQVVPPCGGHLGTVTGKKS